MTDKALERAQEIKAELALLGSYLANNTSAALLDFEPYKDEVIELVNRRRADYIDKLKAEYEAL